jgi:hypothetical protein
MKDLGPGKPAFIFMLLLSASANPPHAGFYGGPARSEKSRAGPRLKYPAACLIEIQAPMQKTWIKQTAKAH